MPNLDYDWAQARRNEHETRLRFDPMSLHKGNDHRLLLVNGPNLNLLGHRDPTHYGHFTLADVENRTCAVANSLGYALDCYQSNHEGDLVDLIQAASGRYAGALLNAGALTHYSYALRDAIEASGIPVLEVHISDIAKREPFRQHSVIHPVCCRQVKGLGLDSYLVGTRELVAVLTGGQQ